jgi:hypothetical protein
MLLDYIFEFKVNVDRMNSLGAGNKARLTPIKDSTQVEKFFIKERPYTQLSDHYGISTILEYSEDLTDYE